MSDYDQRVDAWVTSGGEPPQPWDEPAKRYAIVAGARDKAQVSAYLPDNYRVIPNTDAACIIIEGRDVAGWTLDGYVIPRLASGLIFAREIDLSDPIMRTVPS